MGAQFNLLGLPNELIVNVVSYLDLFTLRTLLVVSSHVCSMAIVIVSDSDRRNKLFANIPNIHILQLDNFGDLQPHQINTRPLRIVEAGSTFLQTKVPKQGEHTNWFSMAASNHVKRPLAFILCSNVDDQLVGMFYRSRRNRFSTVDSTKGHWSHQWAHEGLEAFRGHVITHLHSDWISLHRDIGSQKFSDLVSLDVGLNSNFQNLYFPRLVSMTLQFFNKDVETGICHKISLITAPAVRSCRIFFTGYMPLFGSGVKIGSCALLNRGDYSLFELSCTGSMVSTPRSYMVVPRKFTERNYPLWFRHCRFTERFTKIVLKGVHPDFTKRLSFKMLQELEIVHNVEYEGARQGYITLKAYCLDKFYFIAGLPGTKVPRTPRSLLKKLVIYATQPGCCLLDSFRVMHMHRLSQLIICDAQPVVMNFGYSGERIMIDGTILQNVTQQHSLRSLTLHGCLLGFHNYLLGDPLNMGKQHYPSQIEHIPRPCKHHKRLGV